MLSNNSHHSTDLPEDDCLLALTRPRSVALIGASGKVNKLTARPQLFMAQHGFEGAVYPVNPWSEVIHGLKAYRRVSDIPESVDHAYILLGSEQVTGALEECAAAGVKVVSVLADGFAEAGPEGVARQARLADLAQEAGILLIGPNSTGVVDTRSGFACTTNAAFRTDKLTPGRLAVISQSGSLIGALMSRGQARGVAFSTLVSVGNEASAGVGKLGATLLQDEGTDAFLLFLETIRDPDALEAFARSAEARGKPVVAYLLGKSDEGQALAVSHTGAITGSWKATHAFLRSIGVSVASQFDTLFEAPAALMSRSRLAGRPKRLTVLTTTGGGGAMVVDQLSLRGVEIAGCSANARKILSAKDIPLGNGKLVDVTLAGTRYETMKAVVSELINDPETGALLVAIGSSAQFNPELSITPIIDAVAESGSSAAPVFGLPLPDAPRSIELLEAGGVPAFRSVEACADALALTLNGTPPESRPRPHLPEKVAKQLDAATPGLLNEIEAGKVFHALGVPVPRYEVLPADTEHAGQIDLCFPVVVKLVSRDLPHKTEVGAIRIGIENAEALNAAILEIRREVRRNAPGAHIQGVLVQEMRQGLGEALVGLTRDPLVGPVITVAAGGIATEIYKDGSVRPAPVSIEIAREMLNEVKAFALLRGFRGRPYGDMNALAEAVAAISALALRVDVEEAEINPLLVCPDGEGVILLDALIRKG